MNICSKDNATYVASAAKPAAAIAMATRTDPAAVKAAMQKTKRMKRATAFTCEFV
jgi:hypothetical protein